MVTAVSQKWRPDWKRADLLKQYIFVLVDFLRENSSHCPHAGNTVVYSSVLLCMFYCKIIEFYN